MKLLTRSLTVLCVLINFPGLSTGCPGGKVACPDTPGSVAYCIYSSDVCDGYPDCPQGFDEENCPGTTPLPTQTTQMIWTWSDTSSASPWTRDKSLTPETTSTNVATREQTVPTVPTVPILPPVSTVQRIPTPPQVPTLPPLPTEPLPEETLPPVQIIPQETRPPPVPTVPRVTTPLPEPTLPPVPSIPQETSPPPVSTVPTVPTIPKVTTLLPVPTLPPMPTLPTSRSCSGPSDQYKCKSFFLVCIPPFWKCDGESDCPDGDDEENCQVQSCMSNLYECQGSHQCLNPLWVCDGDIDCPLADDERDCEGPQVTFQCSKPITRDGYVRGKSVECICKLVDPPDGQTGTIEWDVVKGPTHAKIKGNSITLEYYRFHKELHYMCRGYLVSAYRGNYTHIKAKFAFFDDNSATLRPSVLTVCNKNNDEGKTNETSSSVHSSTSSSSLEMGTTATSALSSSDSSNLLTCQVSKFNVNPAPLFSFSVNGEAFDSPVTGEDTGSHYVRHLRFELKSGGRHFVRCLVTNPIFTDLQQEVHKPVWVQEPPAQPPVLTVFGQNYQGENNPDVTLTLSHLVDPENVTCVVRGGYPEATVVHAECGWQHSNSSSSSGKGNSSQVHVEISRLYCSCAAEHVSGCYSNNQTKVTMVLRNVLSEKETTLGHQDQTTVSGELQATNLSTTMASSNEEHASDSGTSQTTKSTTPSSSDQSSPRTSHDSNHNNHTKLLHAFIIVSIIAVVIIVVLVIVIVAIVIRRRKAYNVG
ncbi:hypothetical protein RRG08_063052 [Elysia crispata]|uniref:Uncharacterized protein n=1 Tax=Elysia crispata TaxID=231223 RepID=A0AAE1CU37_9GAST|nr:hypothetical protein RRG08_063052 [Elysia crispata]